jgi:hypothetical protein
MILTVVVRGRPVVLVTASRFAVSVVSAYPVRVPHCTISILYYYN